MKSYVFTAEILQLKILLICLKDLLGMDPTLVIPLSSAILTAAWNTKSLHVCYQRPVSGPTTKLRKWVCIITSERYLMSVCLCIVKWIESDGEEYSLFFSRLDY